MDPITRAMFMGAAGEEGLIGTFLEGGYFAGYISQTADGNATHGLIVGPKVVGESTSLAWKTTLTTTSGTDSLYDGVANTASMSNADHPAANFCAGLSINGYSDWYLPALYELEIAYYNLKPTATANTTDDGQNPYSVPKRTVNYTGGFPAVNPAQTSASIFRSGGSQAFEGDIYWTSSQRDEFNGYYIGFSSGSASALGKTESIYVRAFRKFAV